MTDSKTPSKLDPVAQAILSRVVAGGASGTCSPTDIAQALAEERRKPSDPPDLWRRYLQAVNEQARFLARRGDIVILRRTRIQDPAKPIKGVIRLALPGGPWKPPAAGDDADLDSED